MVRKAGATLRICNLGCSPRHFTQRQNHRNGVGPFSRSESAARGSGQMPSTVGPPESTGVARPAAGFPERIREPAMGSGAHRSQLESLAGRTRPGHSSVAHEFPGGRLQTGGGLLPELRSAIRKRFERPESDEDRGDCPIHVHHRSLGGFRGMMLRRADDHHRERKPSIRRTSFSCCLRASSCSQTRNTLQPRERSVFPTSLSRSLFAVSFFLQKARLLAGVL